jgi:hypothetical protein
MSIPHPLVIFGVAERVARIVPRGSYVITKDRSLVTLDADEQP